MQLFIRNGQTLCLTAEQSDTVLSLKSQVFQRQGIPETEQRLVYGGKQLRDGDSLAVAGLNQDATVHLVLRLCGGKGGFGALLRAGARSSVGENTDAYRDLSGRRLRHVNADQKLQEWQAQARERELEKVAYKHIKEQAKAEERRARTEVDVDAVRVEHQQNMRHVKGAIGDALAGLPVGIKRDSDAVGRADAAGPAKRARIFGDSGSDSEDSDEEEAAAAAAAGAGSGAAASSGPSSSTDGAASTADSPSADGSPAAEEAGAAAPRSSSGGSPAAEPDQQAAAVVLSPVSREPSAASDGSEATAATLIAPADVSPSADPAAAATPAAAAAAATVVLEELDYGQYEHAAALEVLGLEVLKAHLTARGLKCGGSLSQRAERLFLLKNTPIEQLDRKHLAKPARG